MIDDAQLARRLLDLDLVDRTRLKEGRQLQLTHGTTLYSALIRHAIVEERVVVDTAASLLNLRCVHLDETRIDRDVTALLSPTLARQHRVLPIELKRDGKEEQLVLAMEDPLDIMAMDDIATALGINIQPVLVGPVDIDSGLDRAYMERFPSSDDLGAGVDFGALSDENNGRLVEDSWGAFFDDAQSQEVPLEESSIISQEMRDRPSTVHLDDWDIDEVLEDDPISLLDEPSIAHHSEPVDSLADWEVDESIVEGRPAPAVPRLSRSGKGSPRQRPDYGSIGNFYVQNPADDPSLPPPSTELAEEDLVEEVPEEQELVDASPSPSREILVADDAPSQKKPLTFEELLEDKPSPEGTYVAGPSQSFTELAEELGLGDLSDPSKAKDKDAERPGEPAQGEDSDVSEVEDSSYTAVASAPHLLSIPSVPPAEKKKEDLEEESDDIFDLAISEAIGSTAGASANVASEDAASEDAGEDEEEEFVLELDDLVEPEAPAPEDGASAEGEEEEILLEEIEEEPEEEIELADLVEEDAEEEPEEEDKKPGMLGKLKLKRIAVPRVGVIVEKQSHRKKKPAKKAAPEKKPAASAPEKPPEKKSDPLLSEEDLIKGFQDAFDDFDLEPIETSSEKESLDRDPSTREVTPADLLAASRSVGQEETFAAEEPEAIAVEVDREVVKAQESKEAKARRLRSLLNKGRSADAEDSSDADDAPEDEHVTTEFDTLNAREAKEEEERSEAGVAPEASSSPSLQEEGENPNRETAANEALTQEFLQRMRRETSGVGMKSKKDTKPKSTLQAAIGTIPEDLSNSQVLRAAIMLLVAKDIISYEDLLSLARSLPDED